MSAGKFTDSKMQQIADEATLPAAVVDWIKDQGVDSVKKMALAASKEEDVHDSFSGPMKGTRKLGTQASIKEFWCERRTTMEANTSRCVW